VAVVMQRRAVQNRWVDCVWEPWSVLASEERGAARQLLDEPGLAQWLHPGFTLQLHRDEAEGYYLNVSGRRLAYSSSGAWTTIAACRSTSP
jgi:hypothetical protein